MVPRPRVAGDLDFSREAQLMRPPWVETTCSIQLSYRGAGAIITARQEATPSPQRAVEASPPIGTTTGSLWQY